MGFTIGGIRDMRELRRVPRRRPRRDNHAPEVTAVAEYAGLWGWEVLPGALAGHDGAGRLFCSCAEPRCDSPGAHPLDPELVIRAGTTLEGVTRAWAECPGAGVLLPTGRSFDVVEAPHAAAELALLRMERLGLRLGPVALAPHGRVWFFTSPGTARLMPGLLDGMGWDAPTVDVRGLGPGHHITAPPSNHGGQGPVRWLRAPGPESALSPPDGRLLLGTLAYTCQRGADLPAAS
ncbi:bifunctional DNA primase/polymerase [Streptomyces otsuchiensis]|uniref:bifunctional DNA primase/polymerase n=1 Tax=Streptomyces otsuchiensis TaxID=2681388 RepID=UPI0010320086|nr:bifunctional DNA primase/polymerase [Streptomyces otsuchiensis]